MIGLERRIDQRILRSNQPAMNFFVANKILYTLFKHIRAVMPFGASTNESLVNAKHVVQAKSRVKHCTKECEDRLAVDQSTPFGTPIEIDIVNRMLRQVRRPIIEKILDLVVAKHTGQDNVPVDVELVQIF
jgi:hypothetical protein